MKTAPPRPIPIPLAERWRDARLRILPAVVFCAVLALIAALWNEYVGAPTMVGQAEPVLANVTSYKAGVLAELTVARFQKVKAGDAIGQVLVTDPRILASSLAVIQAEIDSLRANAKPIITQQRNAMDYDQLRLDWLKERAQLATSRVSLEQAIADFSRMEELFKDKIISQRVFEERKSARDRLQQEVDALARLVEEGEQRLKDLQVADGADPSKISVDPLRAEIAVQEAKLRLTEAELSPITLRAPIDGIVTIIHHRAGEAVTAGQPILAIATLNPVRIVGYLRPPSPAGPKVGTRVEVRTRGFHRQTGSAKIVEIGTQLEPVPATLASPVKLASAELGLPVDISLPQNLTIRPGEIVDLVLMSD